MNRKAHDASAGNANGTQPVSAPPPRWETAVMVLSFVLLWVWWLARQAAYRDREPLQPLWYLLLPVLVGLLVWIFVRRARRAMAAVKALRQAPGRPPGT